MNKIIGIVGSGRKKGNTYTAMNLLLNKLDNTNITTEIIELVDYKILECNGCDFCRRENECVLNDDLDLIFKKTLSAKGIILGAPVYNYGPTSQISSFKIRAVRLAQAQFIKDNEPNDKIFNHPYPTIYKRKVGACYVVGRRGGCSQTLSVLNSFFLSTGMYLVGSNYLNMIYGYDKGDILQDKEGVRNLTFLAENFSYLINYLYTEKN